jgi:hypothetical protein
MSSHEKPINANKFEEPFVRVHDVEFQSMVRESFADLLEDRATDPERQDVSEKLYELSKMVRVGNKIPRTPAAVTIFRGLFFNEESPMQLYGVTHAEIDSLEKYFFQETQQN